MKHLVNKSDPRTVRFVSPAMALRAVECLSAYAGLPEPEKNIRELVDRVRGLLDGLKNGHRRQIDFYRDKCKEALAPFKEKK